MSFLQILIHFKGWVGFFWCFWGVLLLEATSFGISRLHPEFFMESGSFEAGRSKILGICGKKMVGIMEVSMEGEVGAAAEFDRFGLILI